jgi:hypothetical protein
MKKCGNSDGENLCNIIAHGGGDRWERNCQNSLQWAKEFQAKEAHFA